MSYRVNYGELEMMVTVLNGLQDEFEGLEGNVDGYLDATGHEGLSDAMNEWSENWSDDRGDIIETMQAVAEYGEGAARGYRDADEGLRDEYANQGG